jgi:hypothetical protein
MLYDSLEELHLKTASESRITRYALRMTDQLESEARVEGQVLHHQAENFELRNQEEFEVVQDHL